MASTLSLDQLMRLSPSELDQCVGSYKINADGTMEKKRSLDEASPDVRKFYTRLAPRDISLAACHTEEPREETFPPECALPAAFDDCICFQACRGSHVGMLQKIFKIGSVVDCGGDIPLAHAHVLWNCCLRINAVGDEENGRQLEFVLVHRGAHLGPESNLSGAPSGRAPLMTAFLMVQVDGQKTFMHGTSADCGDLVFNEKLAWAPLLKCQDPTMLLMSLIYVPRAYFDLANIIDLNARPPTVSNETACTIGAILRGERLPGHCVEFAVEAYRKPDGEIVRKLFFLRHSVIDAVSDLLKTEKHSDGKIYPVIDFFAKDMAVVVPLLYDVPMSLPGGSGVPTLIKCLRQFFHEDHLKNVLAPQWERDICKQALALDPKQVSTFAAIWRLLPIVWSFPRGWMPVAKRVTVGVLADTVHLNAGDDIGAFLVQREEEVRSGHWKVEAVESVRAAIMDSMDKHLFMVSSVRKTGLKRAAAIEEEALAGGDKKIDDVIKKESEAVDLNDEVLAGGDTQKKVDEVIQMESGAGDVNDEEEWDDVEEETGGFQPVCQCAIS